MATFNRKPQAQVQPQPQPNGEEEVTLVYQVSRLVKDKEKGDQLLLREYYNDGVKALARLYFGWDVPSISGLAIALEYRGETTHTVDLESEYYFKTVIPVAKYASDIRRQLKPYNGRLATPKTNSQGVSTLYNIQLRITLKGDPRFHVQKSTTASGRQYNWEVYQFEPHHVLGVEIIDAQDDKFILPVMKGKEIDFALAMETKKKRGRKRRRGKQSKDVRLQAKRQELKDVLAMKDDVLRAKTSLAQQARKLAEIEEVEASIQKAIAEIEALL